MRGTDYFGTRAESRLVRVSVIAGSGPGASCFVHRE